MGRSLALKHPFFSIINTRIYEGVFLFCFLNPVFTRSNHFEVHEKSLRCGDKISNDESLDLFTFQGCQRPVCLLQKMQNASLTLLTANLKPFNQIVSSWFSHFLR